MMQRIMQKKLRVFLGQQTGLNPKLNTMEPVGYMKNKKKQMINYNTEEEN